MTHYDDFYARREEDRMAAKQKPFLPPTEPAKQARETVKKWRDAPRAQKDALDALIDAVPVPAARVRCHVCQNLDLAAMVKRWLERRAAGENLPGLETMTRDLFAKYSGSVSSIGRHVRNCLHLNHRTGKPL